jgi:hypothetical protein
MSLTMAMSLATAALQASLSGFFVCPPSTLGRLRAAPAGLCSAVRGSLACIFDRHSALPSPQRLHQRASPSHRLRLPPPPPASHPSSITPPPPSSAAPPSAPRPSVEPQPTSQPPHYWHQQHLHFRRFLSKSLKVRQRSMCQYSRY